MGQTDRPHRYIFGMREEHVIALLMMPLLLGCLFSRPFIVEVQNFNTGANSAELVYAGAENQSVAINVSKYVVVGNWSNSSIFTNFTLQLCPTSGSPSDITLYWPYTNGSTVLHSGVLTGCENVTVNTSEFDPYFQTDMGLILDTRLMGANISSLNMNTMMLRNPHMYHLSEDVWFTMLVPENVSTELIANITGTNLTIPEIHGIGYSCQPNDTIRYVYQPAEVINLTLSDVGLGGLPIPPFGVATGSINIYDMRCPAYLNEGKYRAEIKQLNLTLRNASFFVSVPIAEDHFTAPSLNSTLWLVLPVLGPEIAYYDDNYAGGTYDMYSPVAGSGLITYYNNSIALGDNDSVWAYANVSTDDLGSLMSQSVAAVVFLNETTPPIPSSQIGSLVRGGLLFGNDSWVVTCPDGTMGGAGAYTPGWHTFGMNFTNETQLFYVDEVNVYNCTNSTSGPLYFALSSDPLTDLFFGNVSVRLANVTTYHNGVASSMEDNFTSPLDLSRWLPFVVNGTNAYAVNNYSDSKLGLYSWSPSNASGLAAYALIPILPPQELENMTYLNFSSYNITGLNISDIGWNITVTMNLSEVQASNFSAAIAFMNFTVPPADIATLTPFFRGGFFMNSSDGAAICPDGSVLSAGPVPAGVHTFGFVSTNSSFDFYFDGASLGSCAPVNETLVLLLTPDILTDDYNGNVSFDEVKFEVFATVRGSGSFWYDVPADYAYSDVIVCDCPDSWNAPYQLNLSSQTAGRLNVTIINISYNNLLGYRSGQPTSDFDPNRLFSWMAYDSNITNTDIRYQSGIGRSNIRNSKIFASDIDCANVSDSNLTGFIYISRNVTQVISDLGLGIPIDLPVGDRPCGQVRNSLVVGGVFISGDIINSNISNAVMPFADFNNATVSLFYLSKGSMTINMTRWAPNMTTYSLPILSGLPFGCAPNTSFAIDGAPTLTISHSNHSIDCIVNIQNTPGMTFDNLWFNNSVNGLTIIMDNSTVAFTNMEGFNVQVLDPNVDLLFSGLNTSISGPVVFSNSQQHLVRGLIAMNSSNYTFLDGINVTVVLKNVDNKPLYYYPEFTDDSLLALRNGTLCNDSICRNMTYNAAQRTLTFTTSNFSTYVVGTPPRPPSSGGSSNLENGELDWQVLCPGNTLRVNATEGDGSPISDLRIVLQIYTAAGYQSLGVAYTGDDGLASFPLTQDGSYQLTGTKTNYVTVEKTFAATLCQQEPIPPKNPEQPPAETKNETKPEEKPPEQPPVKPPEEKPPEQPPLQPPETKPPVEKPIIPPQETPKECCLLGLCGSLLGVCWYWWATIGIVAVVGILALILFFLTKKKRYN